MAGAVRRWLHRRLRRPDADDRLHDRTNGGGVLMAAETSAPATGADDGQPNHGARIFIIWLVVALAADLLIWFVLGPHLPPGNMASASGGQQFDIKVMAVMAAPVMALVLVFF